MILHPTVDAYASQAAPTSNYGSSSKLQLRGSGSSLQKQVFIHFPRPFPLSATVTSATLRVYLRGSWASSNDITAKRVTTTWTESGLTWNRRPSISATHAVAANVTTGADKQVVEFDITNMLQDVSDGGAWFGVALLLTQDVARALRSSEDGDPTLRPQLELEWTDQPLPPDRLAPDGGVAVSGAFPRVSWRYRDKIAGHTQQAYSEVQIAASTAGFSTATGFVSPAYDSGQVANDASDFVIDGTGGYPGLTADATAYWAVRVWDDTGLVSDWSQPAETVYTTLGTLTINSPGSTVPETTPPISWTLSGRTQKSYQVTLFEVPPVGKLLELWKASATSTETAVTPPAGLIINGTTYQAKVEVWDNILRVADDHASRTQNFTYAADGTPDPVDTFAVSGVAGSPAVIMDFTRATQPDFFCLLVDDTIVLDRIDPDDIVISPGVFRFTYWGATPRVTHEYEIQAVVQSGGPATPFKHSASSAAIDFTTKPTGIWLVDESDGTAVQIVGTDTFAATVGESATTYDPVGSRIPVRITDSIRGYEGTVTGAVLGTSDRDDFLTLKSRQNTKRLIIGALSIPIALEAVGIVPTPAPGDIEHDVSFGFFQIGPPWPTAAIS